MSYNWKEEDLDDEDWDDEDDEDWDDDEDNQSLNQPISSNSHFFYFL